MVGDGGGDGDDDGGGGGAEARSGVEYSLVLHMDQPWAARLEQAKRKRVWLSVGEGARRLWIQVKGLNIALSSSREASSNV